MSQNIGNILNEVEVLVFRVGVYRLGINVANVRELLSSQPICQLPKAHPSVVGCFRLRDVVVPCVSLHRHLNQGPRGPAECNLILTEFNHCQTAFIVDEVERIHRLGWEGILPVLSIATNSSCPVTAVTNLDGSLVAMVDFETITASISPTNQVPATVGNPNGVPRDSLRILVVDDSATVRNALRATLANSGYTQVVCFEHGREAWNWIQHCMRDATDVRQVAHVVVSDVEMPSMDGLHLTRKIKEHRQLCELPVVLYSSILTPDNRKKGEAVGADAQITKPELARVVELADELALKRSNSVLSTPGARDETAETPLRDATTTAV